MREGRLESEWNKVSQICYTTALAFADKKSAKKMRREDFNLYRLARESEKTPKQSTPEQISFLKEQLSRRR